jgi:serine/threonine-protein kinase
MGSVWVADQLALGTQVAVKVITGNRNKQPELLARFEREARSAARIKSPHVVQIHDHGQTEAGDPYMVMELLEGEDLSARLQREGPMRLEDVGRVLQQTGRVLTKAHELGIVHRDIKPSNIFLVDMGGDIFVKLLDFGVAKTSDEGKELTSTGVLIGTLVYMCPEQLIDARNVDYRADLWSLAVVAYRAITTDLPFKDDNGVGALVLALDRGSYTPASELAPGLPPEIDAWFKKAFARQPEDRFQSATELVNAFLQAISGAVSSPLSLQPDGRISLLGTVNPNAAATPTLDQPRIPTAVASNPTGVSAKTNDAAGRATRPDRGHGDRPQDPPTMGTAPVTYSGRRSEANARSGLRRMLLAIAVAAGVGGISLAVLRNNRNANSATSSTIGAESVAPSNPPVSAKPIESVPAIEASAAASASLSTSSTAPAPTPSIAASASAAPTTSARIGPKGRLPGARPTNHPEKDYGF